MHLYPESLLLTAAVLLPNLLFFALPPVNAETYGKPGASLALTILERAGQVSCFVLPLFFSLAFAGTGARAAWIVMGVSLAVYYVGWIRFFIRGRDYALLFQPLLGIPVPMAAAPVLYFLCASLVLGSAVQAVGAALLGVGHIGISMREYARIKP
jgi:hypothetical protein